MKKFLLTMFVLLFVTNISSAQDDRGIKFMPNEARFSDAISKAQATGKKIFLDCYTSWCGPCKMMARDVFTQQKVGDFMNTRFICIKIDMEKGEGPELAKKFQINAYPTFIVFNSNGEEIGRFLGGSDADKFITNVEKAATDNSSAEMDSRYAAGERSDDFLYQYLETLGASYKQAQCNEVAEYLLKDKAEAFAADKKLADVFMKYINNPYCPAFIYTAKHPETLANTVGERNTTMKIRSVWMRYPHSLINATDSTVTLDEEGLDKFCTLMKDCNVDDSTSYTLRSSTLMKFYEKKKDWNSYIDCIEAYGKKFDIEDLTLLKWTKPVLEAEANHSQLKRVRDLLNQRLNELQSGKRLPQTYAGSMKLSGNLDKALIMIIGKLDKQIDSTE